jgi:site-specific recombinase XerD
MASPHRRNEMLIHPLINLENVNSFEFYKKGERYPFSFPMNLDDSGLMAQEEMVMACAFLDKYKENKSTLDNYAKELEKFYQWLWRIKRINILSLDGDNSLEYMGFIEAPPYHWISRNGTKQKFNKDGTAFERWRPFSARKGGEYKASTPSILATISVLKSFFNFLLDNRIAKTNPFLRTKKDLVRLGRF